MELKVKERLKISCLEVSYIPTWVGYGEDGKTHYEHSIIGGRHSIECKYMPEELRAKIVEFVINVEKAHDE